MGLGAAHPCPHTARVSEHTTVTCQLAADHGGAHTGEYLILQRIVWRDPEQMAQADRERLERERQREAAWQRRRRWWRRSAAESRC